LSATEKKTVHGYAEQLIKKCISDDNIHLCEINLALIGEHSYVIHVDKQATSSYRNIDDQFEDWLEESNAVEENEVSKYIRSSLENELDLGKFFG